MKYFFILGTNPTLSIAELSAVFPSTSSGQVVNNILIINTSDTISAPELIKRLGGTIKIGEIITQVKSSDEDGALNEVMKVISPTTGKFNFGISPYGLKKASIKGLAMKIKHNLKKKNISSRWVTSKEQTLSSVVVEQNKLTTTGAEIVLIKDNGSLYIGKTLVVQPFKALSERDYGRPARDDASGMIPPKLAQIMINLSLPNSVETQNLASPRHARPPNWRGASLLDPFCGSGTILTEALLMGFKNVIGSDISEKAISDTKQNIEWTIGKHSITGSQYEIIQSDVVMLIKHVDPKSIDAIVTEPYLGPQRGKYNVSKVIAELGELYSNALLEFAKIIKPGSRVVMVWPVYRERNNSFHLLPELNKFKIINPILENLRNNKFIKLTKRKTIIWARKPEGLARNSSITIVI